MTRNCCPDCSKKKCECVTADEVRATISATRAALLTVAHRVDTLKDPDHLRQLAFAVEQLKACAFELQYGLDEVRATKPQLRLIRGDQ
jgi:hypothetical protein